MNDIARQVVKDVESSGHKQTETNSADIEQPISQLSIVAGTSEGLLFFDSEQNIELENLSIDAIALSSDGIWAIAEGRAVWHRNSNDEWHQVALVNDLELNCILPLENAVLVGTSGACLLQIADRNIYRLSCFEGIEEKDEWYTPWGAPPDVRSMAVSQSGELYANVHVGGILRSLDRGQSWEPTIDFHADVHEVKTVPEHPDLVLAATARGLAISTDRGNSWNFDRANLHADYARAVAVCGETILMSVSTGPRTDKAAIYRRPLAESGTFEKCDRGLPKWFSDNINTGTLATSGNLTAFGTSDGQIFLSKDAGKSWEQVATNLPPIRCLIFDRLK